MNKNTIGEKFQDNNKDKRCLGIIRFWDESRSFGFIDTNLYGIEDVANNPTTSPGVELYFNYRDIAYAMHPYDGEWVTFIYKPSQRPNQRGFANHVRPLRYDESELQLLLHYQGLYAIIRTPNYGVTVIPRLLDDFLLYATNKQAIFNWIIEVSLQTDESKEILRSIANKTCLDILFYPDKYNVSIDNIADYKDLQSKILLHLFNTTKQEESYQVITHNVDAILTCISHIDDDVVEKLRNTLDLNDNKTLSLLQRLPADSIQVIFMSSTNSESQKNLQSKLVDIWNREVLLAGSVPLPSQNGYLILWERMLKPEFKQSFIKLICENTNSSDYLFLHCFLFLKDETFFHKIKDKSIFTSWLPKCHYYSIRAFMNVCSILPEELLQKTIEAIGPRTIIQFYQYEKLDVSILPKQLVVRLYAKVITYNSIDSIQWETVESGGHFTWGEGWQESYTTYKLTCIDKDCSYEMYVDGEYYGIVKHSLQTRRIEIDKQVCYCIENQKSSCVFVGEANGKDVFFSIELQEFKPKPNYLPLYSGSRQTIRIITKRETEL